MESDSFDPWVLDKCDVDEYSGNTTATYTDGANGRKRVVCMQSGTVETSFFEGDQITEVSTLYADGTVQTAFPGGGYRLANPNKNIYIDLPTGEEVAEFFRRAYRRRLGLDDSSGPDQNPDGSTGSEATE